QIQAADKRAAQLAKQNEFGGSLDVSTLEGAQAILANQRSAEDFARLYASSPGGAAFAAREFQRQQALVAQAQQTINVKISGVWDSRSQTELTQATQTGVTRALSLSRPGYQG